MTVSVGHLGMSDVTSFSINRRFSSLPGTEAQDGQYRSNGNLVALLDQMLRYAGTANELEPTMSVTVGHLKVPDVTLCSTVCRGSSPPCTLQDTRRLNVRLCNRAESYPTVKRSSADEGETEVFPFS